MSPDSGNIRVFVRWDDDSTVYAGDEIRCTICFKNIATVGSSNPPSSQLKAPPSHQYRTAGTHPSSRLAPPPSTPTSAPRRGHRTSSSLSASPAKTTRARAGSIPWIPNSHSPDTHGSDGNSHRRSVSIVSIGSVTSVDSQATSNAGSTVSRPSRGHGRSASLQIVSRNPVISGPRSGWCSSVSLRHGELCLCVVLILSSSLSSTTTFPRAVIAAAQRFLPSRQGLDLQSTIRRVYGAQHPRCRVNRLPTPSCSSLVRVQVPNGALAALRRDRRGLQDRRDQCEQHTHDSSRRTRQHTSTT